MRIKPGSKLAAAVWGCALLLAAAEGPSPPKDAAYAVVAGTVFRDSGFSLSGATVTLAVKDAPKVKKLQSVSDARGEFAFRVPPVAGTYVVRASMKGFQPAEKEASVTGEERVEVTLMLSSESK
jgi:Carboxypeptidase regulatory-like domain